MNRKSRRLATRTKSIVVSASLAAGSLFGYVGNPRNAAYASGLELPSCTVTNNSDTSTDPGTLRYCIANTAVNGAITFADEVTSITVSTNSPFVIDKSLEIAGKATIAGDGTRSVSPIFSGNNQNRIFEATSGTLTLKDIGLQNARGASNTNTDLKGGAIRAEGNGSDPVNLVLDGIVAKDNRSSAEAGVAISVGGAITVKGDSVVEGNSSGSARGALSAEVINISDNVVFKSNVAYGVGGALGAEKVYISGSPKFISNWSNSSGAGAISANKVYFQDGNSAEFRSNEAYYYSPGGAVWSSYVKLAGEPVFISNRSDNGGAIRTSTIHFDGNSSFTNNYAYSRGGAISADTATGTITGYFKENNASLGPGGAIFLGNSATSVEVANSTFVSNRANSTGGAISSAGSLEVFNSTFTDNRGEQGAAINHAGDAVIDFSTFYKNVTIGGHPDDHGSVFLSGGGHLVSNSIFAGNVTFTGQRPTHDLELINSSSYSVTYSLITSETAAITESGDITNSSPNASGLIFGSPELGPLSDNGGALKTFAPLDSSPVIDAADPSFSIPESGILRFDQRGQNRVSGRIADIGAIEVQKPAPIFSAPAPTTLPILTLNSTGPFAPGEIVFARVTNAVAVTRITIGDKDAEIVEFENGILSFLVPDIETGEYSITGVFDAGTLTFDAGLEVVATAQVENVELTVWTKKISDTEIKLYAKNLVSAGKIQFFHNGNEVAWVRAESEADPKLRTASGSSYLVRTRQLLAGKNVFEIFVDGERVRRTVYSLGG